MHVHSGVVTAENSLLCHILGIWKDWIALVQFWHCKAYSHLFGPGRTEFRVVGPVFKPVCGDITKGPGGTVGHSFVGSVQRHQFQDVPFWARK